MGSGAVGGANITLSFLPFPPRFGGGILTSLPPVAEQGTGACAGDGRALGSSGMALPAPTFSREGRSPLLSGTAGGAGAAPSSLARSRRQRSRSRPTRDVPPSQPAWGTRYYFPVDRVQWD